MNWLTVVLRSLHIFAGVFWIGSLFTVSAFVMPTAAAGIRSAMLVSRLDRLLSGIEAAGGPPKAEQLAKAQALGARLKTSSRAGVVQGAIAVLCMAIARYVVF